MLLHINGKFTMGKFVLNKRINKIQTEIRQTLNET